MTNLARGLLPSALFVLLLGSVGAQVLIPVLASQEAVVFPEVAYLAVPYSVAGILVIACGQVTLIAIWRLLILIESGVIFTRRALRLVDIITASGAVATVVSAGVMIHLLAFVGAHNGTIALGGVAAVAGGSAFVLLMTVMKDLLKSAIADRTELDEVI